MPNMGGMNMNMGGMNQSPIPMGGMANFSQ